MLIKDWKKTLLKAWSSRFMVLAGIFQGLEVAFPYLNLDLPPKTFASIAGGLTFLAFVSRIISQKEFKE